MFLLGETKNEECLKQIKRCRREIRMARLSMAKMRDKVKEKKEVCMEKEKQKEHLLYCLKFIKNSNQKLTDLSVEHNKLGILRGHIANTNEIKFQYELQLRTLQLHEVESEKKLYESGVEDGKILFMESNDEINCLKSRIRGLKNELKILHEEERLLVRGVELLYQSLNGVVNKVPDEMVQGLNMELEEIEKCINDTLPDRTEDIFNTLVISTEETIQNLLKLKRIVVSMYYHVHDS